MKELFENLVQDFCKLCDIKDAASIAAGAPVDIDGVIFCLAYKDLAPDRIMIFCDYGPAPKGREAQAYRSLLETNLCVYETDSAVFSVTPEKGNVICAARFALKSLEAEDLRGVLTHMSRMATDWRRHHLDPEKPVMPSSMQGSGMAGKLAAQLGASKS